MKAKQVVTIIALLVLVNMIINASSNPVRSSKSKHICRSSVIIKLFVCLATLANQSTSDSFEEFLCNRTGPVNHYVCNIFCIMEGYESGLCLNHICTCMS